MEKYTLDRQGLISILKVLAWSVASAIVATLITVVDNTEVAPQYLFLVSMVNTGLYALREFIRSR